MVVNQIGINNKIEKEMLPNKSQALQLSHIFKSKQNKNLNEKQEMAK